ncbi:MAG: sigma-70 family RNA polymerase sigma factor [Bdellovibrionales bacterium]|nr:sigma-70 family RNA polymerase sigma factor [Bdellovibrionales bacterium]
MPRPRIVNPCHNKGRDFGTRGTGRTYKQFDREAQKPLTFAGCECANASVCWAGTSSRSAVKRQSYAYDPEGRYPDLESIPIKSEAEIFGDQLLAMPCHELFRNADSPGTIAHRKKLRDAGIGPGNMFNGCQELEEWLFENRLVNSRAREGVGSRYDCLLGAEIAGRLADFEGFDDADFFALMLEGRRSDKDITFLEYREIFFDSLDAANVFREVSLTRVSTVEDIEERLELDRRQEEFERRFARYLKKLTKKQREAVEAVYLYNPEGKSKVQIAALLGIRVDTLNERIEGAKKKAGREFVDILRNKVRVGVRVAALSRTDQSEPAPSDVRVFDGSGNLLRVIEVEPDNPHPFGKPRERAGISAAQIKARFRAEEAERLRFEWSVNAVPWKEPDHGPT